MLCAQVLEDLCDACVAPGVIRPNYSHSCFTCFASFPDYASRGLGGDNMWEAFDEIQEETHTGKHYRNHFVKVPTAPGEPCRG